MLNIRKFMRSKWKPGLIAVMVLLIIAASLPGLGKIIDSDTQNVFTIGPAYASGTPDYQCNGVNDDEEFQQAINALPSGGGKLLVLAGNYSFSNTVSRAINDVTIEGAGVSSYLANDNSTPLFSAGSQSNWVIRDLKTDNGGVTIAGASNVTLQNATLGATSYGLTTFSGVVAQNITATALTSGRIPYVSTGGLLANESGFEYNASTDTLTAVNITSSGLTAGRIAFIGTAGLITDESGFTYNSGTDTLSVVNITATGLTEGRVAIVGAGGLISDDSGMTYDPATDTLTVSVLDSPTGRTATYVVAASDAPTLVKNQADYVCDGTADDVEIQAAIDAGSANKMKVQLTEGMFYISSSIDVGNSGGGGYLTLAGSGDGTIINLANSSDCDMITDSSAGAAFWGLHLKDFYLDGNSANQSSGNGIALAHAHNPKLSNITVEDAKEVGVKISGSAENATIFRVYNNYCNDSFELSSWCRLLLCTANYATRYGFYIHDTNIVSLLQCRADGGATPTTTHGFLVIDANDVSLIGCEAQYITTYDYEIHSDDQNCHSCTITACRSKNSSATACFYVHSESGKQVQALNFTNNQVFTSSGTGFQMSSVLYRCIITGNIANGEIWSVTGNANIIDCIIDDNFGYTKNAGTVNTGVSADEYSNGYTFQTTLTVSQTDAITVADNAALADGYLLYTLPAGAIIVESAYMSMAVTLAEDTTATADVGLGTVVASGAVATLDGTATFENIITGQTTADCNGTATVKTALPTAGTPFIIESGDAHTLYFNVADTWADTAGVDLTGDIAGTVVLVWRFLA